ncbi:MAG: glucose-6-phosphate isomerase, partial [Alphaproteobacteria bacterium]
AFRAGAKAVIDNAGENPGSDDGPAAGAALHAALLCAHRLRESVLWSYTDELGTFGNWWRQLWAESLGKDEQGTTPIAALGSADQHSQLQLFLDEPLS